MCRKYVSMNWVSIGSDNDLSPIRRRAIVRTNAGIFSYLALSNKIQWNVNQNSYICIQENVFENVVCEMAAILSRPQYVNSLRANFF